MSESATTIRAHAAHFSDLLGRVGPLLRGAGSPDDGAEQLQALRHIDCEIQNIRAALQQSSLAPEASLLLPFAKWLPRYFSMRGDALENATVFGALLPLAQELGHAELELHCHIGMALGLYRMAEYAQALEHATRAHELAQGLCSELLEATASINLGLAEYGMAHWARAKPLFERSLELFRGCGDGQGQASALINLANLADIAGNAEETERLYLESEEISSSCGNRYHQAFARANLAMHYRNAGKLDQALEQQTQALALRRSVGDRYGEGESLRSLAEIHLSRGECEHALELGRQSLALNRERGNRAGEAAALDCLARASTIQGELKPAVDIALEERELCRSLARHALAMQAQCLLANAQYLLGRVKPALTLHAEALAFLRDHEDEKDLRLRSSWLAGPLAACSSYRAAAMALSASIDVVDAYRRHMADAARLELDTALAAGDVTAEELAAWQAEGAALPTHEVLELVQAAVQTVLKQG